MSSALLGRCLLYTTTLSPLGGGDSVVVAADEAAVVSSP
jgi:hypothetical protein